MKRVSFLVGEEKPIKYKLYPGFTLEELFFHQPRALQFKIVVIWSEKTILI